MSFSLVYTYFIEKVVL